MLLINVLVKYLMKQVKNINNFTQFQTYFFSVWHVIKHSYKCLSVYINIIVTLFLIHNSLILSSHNKSFHLSIYSLFSYPNKLFFSANLMRIIDILVYLLFTCTSSNKCNKIEVLLKRDFRPTVLTKYCIQT